MGCCNSKLGSAQPLDNYEIGEVLGSGAFSTVHKSKDRSTQKEVALKISRKKDLCQEDVVGIRQEAEIMQSFSHPNIVQFYSFFENSDNFFSVLEIIEGGQLYDRIATKKKYTENEARDLVGILLNAIKYCHDRRVAHRDLKPENLLMSSHNDDASIKIADFGFAKRCPPGSSLTTPLGSPSFVAPEILMQKPYGVAVDMWSIGVIIFTLIGGYPPFSSQKESELYRKIKSGDFTFDDKHWQSIDPACKNLVSGLLTVDPSKRLSADQALKAEWLQSRISSADLGENLEVFRKYNAARKFKKAANAVIAVNRMKLILGSDKGSESNTETNVSPMAPLDNNTV